MADPEIDRWRNSGSISLWHYDGFPKSYSGYHLMADKHGCAFLLGLVELFRNAQYPARKKIDLEIPGSDQLAVPNCSKKPIPARSVEFRFRRELDDSHWMISDGGNEIVVEMGPVGLCELDRGTSDMILGRGDWSTGADSNALWFWWHPDIDAKAEQGVADQRPAAVKSKLK